MGRRRTKHHDLPPGAHRKGGRLYFGRNDVPLGPDGPEAWEKWARLRGEVRGDTFADAVREYSLHELKKRAPKTQSEYVRQLKLLSGVFGGMRLDAIRPKDVRGYMDRRPAISATREKAVLSLVFEYARERGLTDAPNPAAGIRGTKSHRDVYVTDDMLRAVLAQCDADTADYVEVVYRTGADAGVAALWRAENVRDGALHVQRTKTSQRVRITLEGPLATIIERRLAGRVGNVYLFARRDGEPIGLQNLQRRFRAARDRTAMTWWLKDLRAKAASDALDLKSAQRLLGHADEATTAVYRRARVGERAESITRKLGDGKT